MAGVASGDYEQKRMLGDASLLPALCTICTFIIIIIIIIITLCKQFNTKVTAHMRNTV